MKQLRPWRDQPLRRLSGLGLLSLLILTSEVWSLSIPPHTDRVVDQARLLSPSTLSSLATALAEHEQKTSNQVGVLTIPSLEGHPLEEFSHQVATAWALGQKGTDNGVLFLIAINDKKLRIEVGYGLEGTLTDAKSSRIIRHEVVPHFRAGDFSGGIVAGVNAILGTIDGTYTHPTTSPHPSSEALGFWELFGLAIAVGTFAGLFLGSRRRLTGSIIGAAISFIVAFPATLGLALLASGVTPILVSLFSLARRRSSRQLPAQNTPFGWSTSSWPAGGGMGNDGGFGGGGFGGGGGGFGGGGFGGGGGGFGGGGASGGW